MTNEGEVIAYSLGGGIWLSTILYIIFNLLGHPLFQDLFTHYLLIGLSVVAFYWLVVFASTLD